MSTARLIAEFPDDIPPAAFALLPADKQAQYQELLSMMRAKHSARMFYDIYPDNDNVAPNGRVLYYARDRYEKHVEFFAAGADYRERCALFGNRCGKTTAASYELVCHLTGQYPEWWVGKRFEEPILAWAVGKTNESTRDIVQKTLFGSVKYEGHLRALSGQGMMPGNVIGRPLWKRGAGELLDTIHIRHVSGGWSKLGLKSYEQGRGAFEGTAQHVIWLDEECPLDVYGECVIRTATTGGCVMLTFTPLEGLTETVLQFMVSSGD
jgi:phage terminase large subunit-like protein